MRLWCAPLVFVICLAIFAAVAVADDAPSEDIPLPPTHAKKPKKKSAQRVQVAPPYYPLRLRTNYYILPLLNYTEAQLEPYMDNQTITSHFLGHHATYQRNMNTMHKEWREEHPNSDFASSSVLIQMKNLDKVPEKYRQRFINNAGGYINHAIFWACMSPNENGEDREPTGKLREEIESNFGSYESFKEQFIGNATTYFGSGYVWLVRDSSGALHIITTANQDCPFSSGYSPLLVIDVWEHAYYLQWEFRRAKYVENWWMLVDWQNVADMDHYFTTGELAERWRTKWEKKKTEDSDQCLPPLKSHSKESKDTVAEPKDTVAEPKDTAAEPKQEL